MDEYEGAVVRVEDRQLYVRVSPEPPQTVLDRLGQRGEVTVAAQTPDGDTVELLDNADFVATQPVTKHDGFASFPAKLSEPAASRFASELVGLNFTADGINACTGNPAPDGQGYCLVVSLDGERVSTAGITRELARALEDGRFAEQQWMRVAVANVTTAHDARLAVLSQPILTDLTVTSVDDAATVSVERNWVPDDSPNGRTDDTDEEMPGDEETPTDETTTADGMTEAGTGETATSGENGPGFTPIVGLLGVLIGLAAIRRARSEP